MSGKTADYDTLKEFETSITTERAQAATKIGEQFVKDFAEVKDHDDWKITQDGFILPDKDASGNFKWNDLNKFSEIFLYPKHLFEKDPQFGYHFFRCSAYCF